MCYTSSCFYRRRRTFTTFLDNLISDIQAGTVLSEYSHDNVILEQGRIRKLCFDCSGLVYYYFLQLGKNKAINEIQNFIAQKKGIDKSLVKKIYAREYVDFFTSIRQPKYAKCVHPNDLQHGDLIVYATDDAIHCANHCMLVDSIIKDDEDSFVIAVIDSSKYPHMNDTRGEKQSGVGRGNIVVYRNNGKYNSFLWRKNVYYRNLLFCRMNE